MRRNMLSQKAISEFKVVYKKEFGQDLNDNEAKEMAERFLKIFNIVYKPIPKNFLRVKIKKQRRP
jgi:adenosine deaminase